MSDLYIPPEGLKIVCIAGLGNEGQAIWKQVGILKMSSKNKPILLLDRTFNPAGVYAKEKESSAAILNLFNFTQEELQKRNQYEKKSFSSSRHRSFQDDDIGDDIPF